MSKSLKLSLFTVAWVIAVTPLLASSLWGTLRSGPYAVGYKTIFTYDLSRPFITHDAQGKEILPARQGRQMQISVWYSAKTSRRDFMRFEEYVHLSAQELNFTPLTAEQREQSVQMFMKELESFDYDSSQTQDNHNELIEYIELTSAIFGNTRTIRVVLPTDYYKPENLGQRYSVFYFNDGFAVFKPTGWNAPQTICRLIREGAIPPVIVVGIDNAATIENGTPADRTNEYLPYPDKSEPSAPNPRGKLYPEFLIKEVMPLINQKYRTKIGANNTGIAGASYGGVAALYTVINRPGVFGQLLLESTPLFLSDYKLLEQAKKFNQWPDRVYIGIGTKESDNEELNLRA